MRYYFRKKMTLKTNTFITIEIYLMHDSRSRGPIFVPQITSQHVRLPYTNQILR